MFIILVYDVSVKRVTRVLKKCREYLYWVQNSVFEGEITETRFKRMKAELLKIIDSKEDSIIIYVLRTTRYSRREILGKDKGGVASII